MAESKGTDVAVATTALPTDLIDPATGLPLGMEGMQPSDMKMPRLKIDMKQAEFVDDLSGERFTTLESVIVLGLVTQRVLWEPEVAETPGKPLCKSYEGVKGYANPSTFPWKAAKLKQDDFDEDQPVIECADCPLKEWGSHPDPTKDIPWCTEQKALIINMPISGREGEYFPAVLTVQRSGIKNTNGYFTSFMRSKMPSFTALTTITLEPHKRGAVEFAVPVFTRVGDSENDQWSAYAQDYLRVQAYLTKPPATGTEVVTATETDGGGALDDDEDPPF